MLTKHHDYDALPTDKRAPSIRQEMRVVAVVVLFIIALEIVARIMAPTLDYDREHIHAFPEIISEANKQSKETQKPNIVFFGNSLMMHGLDNALLQSKLTQQSGPDIVSTKITPVGTAMLDWVYLYKRYFESTNQHPDILIVGFVAHHIHDQEPIKLRRLSRHFVAKQNLPELWTKDLGDFHRVAQSVLCNVSALEGDQPEHQLKILSGIISHYKTGLNRNNELVREAAQRRAGQISSQQINRSTFQRMERLIKICKKHGVEIWFIPMPQPETWPLNPDAIKLAEQHGMKVIDAQQIEDMNETDFSDGYHLGKTGTEKFTHWIAQKLNEQRPLTK